MSTVLVEWIVPLFFLGALVLISRFDRQISSVSRESYRLIAGGITILALVSLANLFRYLGMFGNLPFLSEAVFFDLIVWIFGITGSIFIINGVSHWLPLAREQRKINENAVRKLDLLRRIEQLLGVETRIDSILAASAEYMVSHFDMAFGAVYKYSTRRKQLHFAAGTAKSPSEVERFELPQANLDRLETFESGRPIDLKGLFADFPGEIESPTTVLPLVVDHQPVGFFVLWGGDDSVLTSEDDLTLRLAIDAIVRKIDADKLTLNYQSEVKKRSWKNQLEIIVSGGPTAREAFSALVQCLNQRIPMEFSALALLNRSGERMKRLSWGPGGRVLAETGLAVPARGSLTAEAYLSGKTVVESDLRLENQATSGEIVTDGNVRSLLAAPIVIGGRTQAVITLASSEREAYSDWELRDLEFVMPVLERLVSDEVSRREMKQREERTARLSRFVQDMSGLESLNEILAEAANLVSEEVSADIVRISTPNTEGAFLKSRTLVRSRPFGTMVPANGELIVSLMPLHEQVLRDNQAMLGGSDESNTNIVEFERQQAFATGVRSSMIVPAALGGRVVALISVASMCDNRMLHRDSGALAFVESLADCLVTAVERFQTEAVEAPARPIERDVTAADSEVLARISDSLERRWSRSTGSEDEMIDKYLSVIKRPAPEQEGVAAPEAYD